MHGSDRYAARVDELEALQHELVAQSRPGGPGAVVGRLLETVGDLLRRSEKVPCEAARLDAALKKVPAAGLQSWFDAVSTADLKARLERAADEAVEAAIPDGPEEGETWSAWAMQGLFARDRLESACTALERMNRPEATQFRTRLQTALDSLDASLKSRARWFTPLNENRRSEAQLLNAAQRERAWWFSARTALSDDGLIATLGNPGAGPFSKDSPEAKAAAVVDEPRKRPVSFDELFRYDLGLSTPAEAAFIASQKSSNPELAKALAAMEAGEQAIEELGHDAPAPRRDAGHGPPAAAPTVVDERPDFKLLVFRAKQRVHLVVQPRREGRLAAAAVFLPDAPETSRPSKSSGTGLEFDLGPEDRVQHHTARVVVSLKGGSSTTIAVKL